MRGLLAISAGIDRLNEVIGKAVAWLILLAVLVSATNAVVRQVFSMSSNAWLELQWYLFGAAFLLAAAYTLKQNEHIRIDIVYGLFSRRVQHWIDLFGHVVFLMPFVVLMVWYFVPYVFHSYESGGVSPKPGGRVIWRGTGSQRPGEVVVGLQRVAEIIKKIAVMRGLIPDPHPFVSAHEAAQREGEALAEEIKR